MFFPQCSSSCVESLASDFLSASVSPCCLNSAFLSPRSLTSCFTLAVLCVACFVFSFASPCLVSMSRFTCSPRPFPLSSCYPLCICCVSPSSCCQQGFALLTSVLLWFWYGMLVCLCVLHFWLWKTNGLVTCVIGCCQCVYVQYQSKVWTLVSVHNVCKSSVSNKPILIWVPCFSNFFLTKFKFYFSRQTD